MRMRATNHDFSREPVLRKALDRQCRIFCLKSLEHLVKFSAAFFILFGLIALSITRPNIWEFVSAVACIATGMIICFLAARTAFTEQLWPIMVNHMDDGWNTQLYIRSLNEEIEELKSQLTDPKN